MSYGTAKTMPSIPAGVSWRRPCEHAPKKRFQGHGAFGAMRGNLKSDVLGNRQAACWRRRPMLVNH